jgi:preprotein translocase subunit SecA
MDRFGIEEEQPIEHKLVTRAIENAQRRVEAHNFEIRKHLLEYDNVMNQQREVIYSQRREVLAGQDLKESVKEMIEEQAEGMLIFSQMKKSIQRIGISRVFRPLSMNNLLFDGPSPLWRKMVSIESV